MLTVVNGSVVVNPYFTWIAVHVLSNPTGVIANSETIAIVVIEQVVIDLMTGTRRNHQTASPCAVQPVVIEHAVPCRIVLAIRRPEIPLHPILPIVVEAAVFKEMITAFDIYSMS